MGSKRPNLDLHLLANHLATTSGHTGTASHAHCGCHLDCNLDCHYNLRDYRNCVTHVDPDSTEFHTIDCHGFHRATKPQ